MVRTRFGGRSELKTLYLLRHAKSSWNHPGVRDHERPLNARGRAAAPKIGAYMRDQGWLPELVISSTSERTRQTWALVSEELDGDPRVIFTDEMYHASAGSLMLLIESLPDEVDSVLLLGHNPGTHSAADMLAGNGNDQQIETLEYKFPTAGLAVFEFDTSAWRDCRAKSGELIDFVLPKEI
jgi:phosphohistidine phosphatase